MSAHAYSSTGGCAPTCGACAEERSARSTAATEPPDCSSLVDSYTRELESMARAARAKGLPSALALETMAAAYREEGHEATDEDAREVYEWTLELIRQVDGGLL